jgi:anthranilate phosphoribosyltransferase
MMAFEKPFQFYIQTIGRGRKRRRTLTFEEAKDAMHQILADAVTPMQLGAFLMLIRVREETPEEAAGFVAAIRETIPKIESEIVQVDLDWGSYAGKRREPPWFLLALNLLADNGIKVCLHGVVGNDAARFYTQPVAESLGWPVACSLDEAQFKIARQNRCYVPLEAFAPKVKSLMDKREELGLRSPIHTVARMLNPLQALHSVHGVFHKGYDQLHQAVAQIQCEKEGWRPNQSVWAFCGDSGEAEARADKATTFFVTKCQNSQSCQVFEEEIPKIAESLNRRAKGEVERVLQLWQGTHQDAYAEQTVLQTAALGLMAVQNLPYSDACSQVSSWWQCR